MRSGSTFGSDPNQADDLLVLGDDEGEEGFADGVGFALEEAEAVFADVEVLRGEGDEAALGEAGGEGLVGFESGFADDVLRAAFEAVLADDDGAFFAGLNAVGQRRMP